MEPYKSILDDEPNLCTICRVEGLIDTAFWVKRERDVWRLVIGMVVTDANETERRLTDHSTQHASDQERLERLCSALGIDPLLFTLDDLVARKVGVLEKARRLKTRLHAIAISYFPQERQPQKRKNDDFL